MPAMKERRELQRMPRGERCPECGNRKWYLQDGLRFCSEGHQIEGFIQFDVGEEEGSGRLGAVSRREKEKRVSEKRQLGGPSAKMLYLQAVQLLLRKQALWLVREQKLRAELETAVRLLWNLRIRGSPEDEAVVQGEEMFSSLSSPAQDQVTWTSRSRAQSWDPERGADWPMPTLPDTLALCYLATILLRIPTCQGQLLDWANSGRMPYQKAFDDLPPEMQNRMPSAYVKVLKAPLHSTLGGGKLSKAVMDMVLSFHLNYRLVLPDIGHMAMLVHYAKLLSLPIESVIATKRLTAILEPKFGFPVDKARIRPLDHPEVRLVALLVVATKLCFPLGPGKSPLGRLDGVELPRFDWDAWKRGFLPPPGEGEPSTSKINIDTVTPSQVADMSDQDFDAYSAQLLRLYGGQASESPIAGYFSTPTPPAPVPPVPKTTQGEAFEKSRQLLSQTLQPPSQSRPEESGSTSGPEFGIYMAYPTAKDLPDTARAFYKAVGDAAGIPLEIVVQAVYAQELEADSGPQKGRGADSGAET